MPPEVDTVVMDNYTFVTHTGSSLILDIFECKGTSNIVYDGVREKLADKKGSKLDMVGLSNQAHAVKIDEKSTTFYKVSGELAILRWFPMNVQKGIGTGYLDYSIGTFKY